MALIFLITFISLLHCYKTKNGNQSLISFDNNACIEFYSYPSWFISKNCYVNLNVMSDTPSMIERNGFKSEPFSLTTPDGYILTLFRIKVRNENTTNKQPILLQHGIGADSRIWTAFGNRSLAFTLTSRGYDVFLGNMRGTKYSLSHTVLKPDDFEFWNFNLDNVAANDIKTNLETIASVTAKYHSIIYIGHSLSSVLISMLASEFPTEAEQLLRGIVLLSPIVYFDLAPQLLPLFLGSDTLGDDLLTVFSILPSTTAIQIFRQFSQQYNSNKFQKFDHGIEKNSQIYGEEIPPVYNLNKINKLPVFIFYSQRDSFISEESVKRIYDELGTPDKKNFSVPIGIKEDEYQFNHMDFTWSTYLEKLFSNDLVDILKNELS